MKRTTLVLVIYLFFIQFSYAQNLQWEKVYQEGFSHEILDFKIIEDDKFLVLQDYLPDDYRSKVKVMFLIDSAEYYGFYYGVSTDYYKFENTPAGERILVTLGVENGGYGCNWCSMGDPYEWVFGKVNMNNYDYFTSNHFLEYFQPYEELQNWTVSEWGYYLQPIGYFELGDSVMIISHETGFARIAYDLENSWIDSYDLGLHPVSLKGLFQLNDSIGLAFSQNEIYHMNAQGNLEFVSSLSYSIDTIFQSNENGFFICRTGDTFRYIDENGTVINELNQNAYFDSVMQFDIKANGFQGLGWINNEIHLKENVDGNDVLDFIPDTTKFVIQRFQFSLDNSAFYLLGYESAVDSKHLLMQKYSNEPSNFIRSNVDLALTSIVALNSRGIYCKPYNADEYPNSTWPIKYSLIPLRIVVTNNSENVINSFFINSDYEFQGQNPPTSGAAYCSIYCRDSHFAKLYKDTVTMQPGESKLIEYKLINGTDTITPLPICIWVTSPNFEPDRDPSNDKACIDIQVGLEEIQVSRDDLLIYPNPAFDQLWIKNKDGELFNSIEIIDYSGKSILKHEKDNSINSIDISQLANGLYLIKLTNNSGINYTRKFIVSN